jgi:hypothetical protein
MTRRVSAFRSAEGAVSNRLLSPLPLPRIKPDRDTLFAFVSDSALVLVLAPFAFVSDSALAFALALPQVGGGFSLHKTAARQRLPLCRRRGFQLLALALPLLL